MLVLAAAQLFTRRSATKGSKARAIARTPLNKTARGILLDRVQKDLNDSRFGRGLREAVRVDLNFTEIPDAVPARLRVFARPESGSPEDRPITDPIQKVFEQIAGSRLIILGEPGTGKTTMLLELAQNLIDEARRHSERPIPIVFSLARWTIGTRTRTLAEWMKDDLRLYGLSAAASDTLVREDGLQPLLDGLDEVAEHRRAACVEAIREYQEGRNLGRLAICCRTEEYENLPTKLSGVAIRVEKMTSADLDREIAKPGLEHIREVLAADPALKSVVTTPLWLNVLYLAARVETPEASELSPRDRLYSWYVAFALKRTFDGPARKRTDSKRLLNWLGRLAVEMRHRDQAQLAVEDIDFSWARRRGWKGSVASAAQSTDGDSTRTRTVRPVHRAIFGLSVGLISGLAGGLVFGAVVGLIAAYRVEGKIEPTEDLHFEWLGAISRLHFSVAYGTVFGSAFALVYGVPGGLFVGMVAGVFEALLGGFQPRSVSSTSAPNRETQRSLRYALLIAFTGWILALLLLVLWRMSDSQGLFFFGSRDAVSHAAIWIAFGATILGCEKGGWFALRHYAVRFLLWRRGAAPLAYVRFLNEAVERLFLIRRGGNYEFMHLTFRDFMAANYGLDGADSGLTPSTRQSRIASWVGPLSFLYSCSPSWRRRLSVVSLARSVVR